MKYLAEVAPELDKARRSRHFLGLGLASLEARACELSGRFLIGDQV